MAISVRGRDRHRESKTDGWRNGDTSGWRDQLMGKQMDRHMGRLTDGCIDVHTKRKTGSQTGRWRVNREQDINGKTNKPG